MGNNATNPAEFDDTLTITATVKDQATGAATAVPSFTAGVTGTDVAFTETSALATGSFASVVNGSSSPGSVTVSNYSFQPLTLKTATVSSAYFVVAAKTAWTGCTTGVVAAATSAGPGTCVIPITFKPVVNKSYPTTPVAAPIGAFDDALVITGAITPAIGGAPVTVSIQGQPLSANNSPQMNYNPQASAGTLSFVSTTGAKVTKTIVITNSSDLAQPFTAATFTAPAAFTVSVPTSCSINGGVAVGATCTVSVSVQLGTSASASGNLTFTDPVSNQTVTYVLSATK